MLKFTFRNINSELCDKLGISPGTPNRETLFPKPSHTSRDSYGSRMGMGDPLKKVQFSVSVQTLPIVPVSLGGSHGKQQKIEGYQVINTCFRK